MKRLASLEELSEDAQDEKAEFLGLHWNKSSFQRAVLLVLTAQTIGLLLLSLQLLQPHDNAVARRGLWDTWTKSFENARYIDLTHSFSPESPVWPGFGPEHVAAGSCGKTINGFCTQGEPWTYSKHGFVTTAYTLTTDQLGTQLDPPSHWNELGATIDMIPASVALRPLVIIDVHHETQRDPSYTANRADVLAWEERHDTTIPAGSVVFFRTDWSRSHWQTPPPLADNTTTFPSVGLDALQLLHEERPVLFHGHEPLDTDSTATLEGEAWLMHHDYLQAEGLTNLHLVPEVGCLVSIGFAKPLGGTGGYARYIAICPSGTKYGDSVTDGKGKMPRTSYPLRRGVDGVLRPQKGASPTNYCAEATALGCDNGKPVWTQ